MTATLHHPITREDYDALPGVNWSTLREIHRSPLHYRAKLMLPPARTRSMGTGIYAHIAALEPERWAKFAAEPDFGDCRFKENKTRRDEWRAEHAGAQCIPLADYQRAEGMRDAILGHPAALAALLGRRECAITWTFDGTGLDCKVLLDCLSATWIAELKTTTDVGPAFERRAANLGYHRQLAWQREAVRALTGETMPVVLVAVEQDYPHDVAVYDVDDDLLTTGLVEVRECVSRLVECQQTDVWPGRLGAGRSVLSLPRWYDYDDDGDESPAVTLGGEMIK